MTTPDPDFQLEALTSILSGLQESDQPGSKATSERVFENKLVQVRLGIASALFTALRAKHAPSAEHCIRVALGCSAWTGVVDMPPDERDAIEIAALLHDIGKVGVPDAILLKPQQMTPEEKAVMQRHRLAGLDILAACCSSKPVLEIVRYCGAWFDGSQSGYDRQGTALPLGSRMIAIVDAFDSMTTDQVYRRAMSRERALAELFEHAETQFDPDLVKAFCTLKAEDTSQLDAQIARRWLTELNSEGADSRWQLGEPSRQRHAQTLDDLFGEQLLANMHDGIIFVDTTMQILHWNHGAERLTGISAKSICHNHWEPALVKMRDERGVLVPAEECPLACTMQTGSQLLRRLTISGRGGQPVAINAHLLPIVDDSGVTQGGAIQMRDASPEIDLEQRVQSLHEKATRDPLTQVANRAEFDRTLGRFVETHLQQMLPCSLIICDVDHFKKTNDNYGHQAGDEVLINFAALLKRACRPGDLVARYGGEEFVMLCADCNNATATEKAERIRRELANCPQSWLNGACITASFGVTELQPGDTPETMLRRSDRALLQAKNRGRNMVVQLGSGLHGDAKSKTRGSWLRWLTGGTPEMLLDRTLITSVPLAVAIQKLQGFVADHNAEVTSIDEHNVALRIHGTKLPMTRRSSDRPVPFYIDLHFDEKKIALNGIRHDNDGNRIETGDLALRTLVHVSIRPKRNRDRRRRDAVERARRLLASLKSYLMANDHGQSGKDSSPAEEKSPAAC